MTDTTVEAIPTQVAASGDPSTDRWSRWNRMARRLIWFVALLLFLAVARNGWQAWLYQNRIRALQCNEPVFDFGQVFEEDVVQHTFHVTNVGARPLQIEHVGTTCRCTTLRNDLVGQVVEPGGSFDVPVQLAVSREYSGEFKRPIVIRFAGEPPLQLTMFLKGKVAPLWTWTPARLEFTGVRASEAATQSVVLTRHPDAPYSEIRQLALSGKLIRGEFRKLGISSQPNSWELTATTIPPLPIGRWSTTIYVDLTTDNRQIGPIPVMLIVNE